MRELLKQVLESNSALKTQLQAGRNQSVKAMFISGLRLKNVYRRFHDLTSV